MGSAGAGMRVGARGWLSGVRPLWGRQYYEGVRVPRVRLRLTHGYRVVRPLWGRFAGQWIL